MFYGLVSSSVFNLLFPLLSLYTPSSIASLPAIPHLIHFIFLSHFLPSALFPFPLHSILTLPLSHYLIFLPSSAYLITLFPFGFNFARPLEINCHNSIFFIKMVQNSCQPVRSSEDGRLPVFYKKHYSSLEGVTMQLVEPLLTVQMARVRTWPRMLSV